MRPITFVAATVSLALCAGAWAQPRIVSFGSGSVGISVSNGGLTVAGSNAGGAAIWRAVGSTYSMTELPGARQAVGLSSDEHILAGSVLNTGGLGGFPTDASLAARWVEGTGWQVLPLILPDPALGVDGPGVSGLEMTSPRTLSATGRFIVGLGYIAPDETYRFRPWYWDEQTGETRVLPTPVNPENGRYRNGSALAVSADGSAIVGGYDPNTSEGRVIVWRWNSKSGAYDITYLPDGVDPKGNPIGRSLDGFFINDAGTIISGTSYEWDPKLGFPVGPYVTRWVWNAGTGEWDRQLLDDNLTTQASWWTPPDWCDIPPSLFPTGMSEDGNTIVGIVMYSLCGSFVRGGFIWTAEDNAIVDFYDFPVQAGTPGISDFGPVEPGLPPRLGWANGVSRDGRSFTGYGGPFSGFGPGWVVTLDGGPCVEPFVTSQPTGVAISRCASFIMNAGAGGSGPLTYQWFRGKDALADGTTAWGSVIEGASASQLRITHLTPSDVGEYRCTITGPCGSSVSTDVAVATIDTNFPAIANDTCTTAQEVGEGTFDFTPCGAFVDDGYITACAASNSEDVWFRYTPSFTGLARLETCGASYDTVLSVYSACGGFELGCNDDRANGPLNQCSFVGSRLDMDVVAGEAVLVRVANLGFIFELSSGQLSIGPAPTAPANDTCAGAVPAVVGDNAFSLDEATSDGSATCSFATASRDVWYTYAALSSGTLRLSTCGGAFWDTVLTVFDGCFGSELACNNDTQSKECWSQSVIEGFAVQAGVTYVIRIGTGFDFDAGGPGVMTLSFEPDCRADFNQDGMANSQDFFDFLTAFFKNAPSADFNHDGFVNSQDFFDFLGVFFGGC